MLPQQATTEPAPIEEVKKMNVVVVRGQGQGIGMPRRDPYTMDMDRERNCYIKITESGLSFFYCLSYFYF